MTEREEIPNVVQIGVPAQYRVADFLDWARQNRLELNPDFQRRAIWSLDIKSYLIDSLLQGYSMPTVYMRSRVDTMSQQTVREIVDGQQRVRAILDFANGRLRLNKRAGRFAGLNYANLDDEDKQAFLSYSISVEQLVNASDDTVLEIFARLNTYTVPLNAAELRNAKYNGDFKFAARDLAFRLSWFWDKYKILSTQARLRMLDDELSAEMIGVLLEGVRNAGRSYVDRLYSRFDEALPNADELLSRTEEVVGYMDNCLQGSLRQPFFSRSPQFLILFAAVAHARGGIPAGDLDSDLPPVPPGLVIDCADADDRLAKLGEAAVEDPPPPHYADFALASKGATVRIGSRRTRFGYVWRALTGAS